MLIYDYISKAFSEVHKSSGSLIEPELLSVIHILKYCNIDIDDINVPNDSE